jgi:predicted nuclease of restriction endonuclease-like RecB superfamily
LWDYFLFMLTADLIRTWKKGPYTGPKYINVNAETYLTLAQKLIDLFVEHKGFTRGELQEALRNHLADSPDYLIHRGLSKLLLDRAEFHILQKSGVDPKVLREKLFFRASENAPIVLHPDLIHPVTKGDILESLALELNTDADTIASEMYGDLPQNHILSTFDPPTPEWLLNRYNVGLAQGILYNCVRMRLIAYKNVPARYKQLFKFIKFYQLLHSITGDLHSGYEILLDGPLSMFRLSRKYGIQMATFFPALLLCTKWKMEAEILTEGDRKRYFVLASDQHPLESHYKDATQYDSLLEEKFAEKFKKLKTDWRLERETEIVNLKDTVFIPDFTFKHKIDGSVALLEIVGFWRSDYLKRKIDKIRRAGLSNLIVAVSTTLNVSEEDFRDLPGSFFFFKTSINPKDVLERLEKVAT